MNFNLHEYSEVGNPDSRLRSHNIEHSQCSSNKISAMLVVLLLGYLILPSICLEKGIGDSCLLATRETGICERFSKCLYAQNLVKNSGRPEHCGYLGLEPIVCCVHNKSAQKPDNLQPLIDNKNTRSGNKPGDISRKVCLDMSLVHIKTTKQEPVLIIGVGGKPSLSKEFPHMALIGYGDRDNVEWLCGGSLISDKFVLTAAHCLQPRVFGDAKFVRVGDLDLSNDEDDASPQNFTVIRAIRHPEYVPPSRYNDIALLELDHKVSITEYAAPACLYTKRQVGDIVMMATGWGSTGYTAESSDILIKVKLDAVPDDKCNSAYRNISSSVLPNGIDSDRQICAGGVVGRDTCQGDSGGPLQIFNRTLSSVYNVHMIVGITSFGKACGVTPIPSVYTRVSYYIPWIEAIVWPNVTL